MYLYQDETLELQWVKDRLWINTVKGNLLRIQGLQQSNVLLQTGSDERDYPFFDIRVLPCKSKISLLNRLRLWWNRRKLRKKIRKELNCSDCPLKDECKPQKPLECAERADMFPIE